MLPSFSDNWQWFFAIFGLLGLGGLMTILRAIFGKPKLEFAFQVKDSENGSQQQLVCDFRNSPVRTWLMRLLFVQRPTIESVIISCDVIDRSYTESKLGNPFLVKLEDWDNKISKQLSVPASILPVTFVLASYDRKINKAVLCTDSNDVLLLNGVLYLIRLTAFLGEKKKKAQLVGLIVKDKLVLWKKGVPESLLWGYEK